MRGLSGQVSTTILSVLSEALSRNPDYVFFGNWFENDCWPGSAPTLSTVLAAWNSVQAGIDLVRSAGKVPILTTVLPSGNFDASSAFTGYSAGNGTKAWSWLNAKIREYARLHQDSVLFCDVASLYLDPNTANPVWPENATTFAVASGALNKYTDGVHPYMAGAWKVATALAAMITANVPDPAHFAQGAGDAYNIDPNPLNYGSGGTNGSGTTGTLASLLTFNAYGTVAAIAASAVARTDSLGYWQRCAYTATTGDNAAVNWTSTKTPASVGWAVGDIIEALFEIRIAANPTLLTNVRPALRFSGATDPQWYYGVGYGSSTQDWGQFITTDTTFTFRLPPIAIPSGTTAMSAYINCFGRGACSFTMDIGRRVVRRYPIPDLA